MTKSGPQRFPGALTDHFFQNSFGGTPMETNTIVWHTTETTTLPGFEGGASAPNFTAVPDFAKKRVVWHQHFDFDVSARALRNPAGGVETNKRNTAQVELVGTCDPKFHKKLTSAGTQHLFSEQLPDWVVRDLAKFAKWAKDNHGVPLTSTVTFKAFDGSFGFKNGVRLSAADWNAYKGHCGHQHVPENDHGDPGAFPIAAILAAARKAKVPVSLVGPAPAGGGSIHVVIKGQTLFGIAHSHAMNLEQLFKLNPALKLIDPTKLKVGTTILVPPGH